MTKEQLRQKLKTNPDLLEQFKFEIDERTAIMLEDVAAPDRKLEAATKAHATANVLRNWVK